jgi:hypothetical protein
LKWNVRDDRHAAAAVAKLGDDVLQIRRILHRGGGDAHDLTADRDEFKRLLHAGRRVHCVAGDHGLHGDGMVPADDHAAVAWIANDVFAGLAAFEQVRRFAVAHGGESNSSGQRRTGVSRLLPRTAKPVRLVSKKT